MMVEKDCPNFRPSLYLINGDLDGPNLHKTEIDWHWDRFAEIDKHWG
jgi:hypothetical protein